MDCLAASTLVRSTDSALSPRLTGLTITALLQAKVHSDCAPSSSSLAMDVTAAGFGLSRFSLHPGHSCRSGHCREAAWCSLTISQESLAFYGGPISTCQTTRIPSALRGGIRFLDYRFALKQGKLLAYHGIQNEYCTAEEAFQWVYDFLDGPGKGETVIVSVKQVSVGFKVGFYPTD